MRIRKWNTAIALLLGTSFLLVTAASAQNPYKLLPEARGKLCLNCHQDFNVKMSKAHVHTPVQAGECSGCHNPHASEHGALLAVSAEKVCLTCHEDLLPKEAASSHQEVVYGNCVICHDPHSSENRNSLLSEGNTLCFTCHEDMQKSLDNYAVSHAPVQDDCLSCHNPHTSKENGYLLNTRVPDLCLGCHDSDRRIFKSVHNGYPVEHGRCTTCHNPHGGDQKGILYANSHQPVTSRMCKQCHAEPDSANPFALKRLGFELCSTCHNGMVSDIMSHDSLHWPVVEGKGCSSCHSPHASPERALLRGSEKEVCGSCHADTLVRQELSKTKHEPIAEGNCTVCHQPHASNNAFYLTEESQLDLCGKCHEWQTHSTHPIGEDINDPRNGNLTLTCTSCHRTHGTAAESFLHYGPTSTMCVQCHSQYRR